MTSDNLDIDEFCAKLDDFRNSLAKPGEKELFDAILKTAWQVGAMEAAVETEFSGCFTSAEADAILTHSTGAVDMMYGMIKGHMIKGSVHDGMIRG